MSRTAAPNSGIQVSLWWSPADGRTWAAGHDVSTDAGFVLPVRASERARDVFNHPYACAARRGVPTTAPRRVAAAPLPWRKP
jgi:hypothetical protein